jgi:hypothetical protein
MANANWFYLAGLSMCAVLFACLLIFSGPIGYLVVLSAGLIAYQLERIRMVLLKSTLKVN